MKRFLDFQNHEDELQIIRETVDEDVDVPQKMSLRRLLRTKEIKEVVTLPGTPGAMGPTIGLSVIVVLKDTR